MTICKKCGEDVNLSDRYYYYCRSKCDYHKISVSKCVGPRKEWKRTYTRLVGTWQFFPFLMKGILCSHYMNSFICEYSNCNHNITDNYKKQQYHLSDRPDDYKRYVYSKMKKSKLEKRCDEYLHSMLSHYKLISLEELEIALQTIKSYLLKFNTEIPTFYEYLIGKRTFERTIVDPPVFRSRRERRLYYDRLEEQQQPEIPATSIPMTHNHPKSPFKDENEFIRFVTYCITIHDLNDTSITPRKKNKKTKWEIYKILDREDPNKKKAKDTYKYKDISPSILVDDRNNLKDRIAYLSNDIVLILSIYLQYPNDDLQQENKLIHIFQCDDHTLPSKIMELQSYFIMLWINKDEPIDKFRILENRIVSSIETSIDDESLIKLLRVWQFVVGAFSIENLLSNHPDFIMNMWHPLTDRLNYICNKAVNGNEEISIIREILSSFVCISELISRSRKLYEKKDLENQNIIPSYHDIYITNSIIQSIRLLYHQDKTIQLLIKDYYGYLCHDNYQSKLCIDTSKMLSLFNSSYRVPSQVGYFRIQISQFAFSFMSFIMMRYLYDCIPDLSNLVVDNPDHPILSFIKNESRWSIPNVSTNWKANCIALAQKKNQKKIHQSRNEQRDSKHCNNISFLFRSISYEIISNKKLHSVNDFRYDSSMSKPGGRLDTRKKPRNATKWKRLKNRQTRKEMRSSYSDSSLRYLSFFTNEHDVPSSFRCGSKSDCWR